MMGADPRMADETVGRRNGISFPGSIQISPGLRGDGLLERATQDSQKTPTYGPSLWYDLVLPGLNVISLAG